MADDQPTHERWLPVVGYEKCYEVSDHGRVRSLDRVVKHARYGVQRRAGKVLKQNRDTNGHHQVGLYRDGIRISVFVHRLVATAFIGPIPDGALVLHWDDNKDNNCVENLRFGSYSDNGHDRVRNGIHSQANKTHCPRGHELISVNLVPSSRGRGARACLACSRAKSNVRRRPELKPYIQRVSDDHFKRIVI